MSILLDPFWPSSMLHPLCEHRARALSSAQLQLLLYVPMPYAASKAGVVSLVQTAANELFASGIRVNAICPGLIETGMTKSTFDRARARGTEGKIGQLNPTRRNGNPEEIANMALFLASDEASYVNGQAYAVDGGLSSTHPFVQKV